MAARECHDEPAAVWVCACTPARAFCAPCLLRHVQDPGAHTVSKQGQVYPVCLCRTCVEHLSVGSHPIGKVMMEEVQPPVEGEAAKERNTCLNSFLSQMQNDVRQRLAQVLDSMNNFEEVVTQAIVLDRELTQCRERLRETALVERNAEAEKLQRGRPRNLADSGQLAVEKAVFQESERLKNDTLLERVQTLEKQLVDQQTLTHQLDRLFAEITRLKAELQELFRAAIEEGTSAEHLQEAFQEPQQAAARVAALTEEISPIAHLKIDSYWLNGDTAENLFQLTSLDVSSTLNSAGMCLIVRVSLLLAKLLGPCDEMVTFSKGILDLVLMNPEYGVNLLKNFESIYLRAKGEAKLPEVIKEMIALMGTRECEDSMSVSARMSKVLSHERLCDFTVAVLQYFGNREQLLPEWKGVLMDLPLDWVDQQLAEKCFGSIMLSTINGNFSDKHLALMKLMEICRPMNQTTVMTFAEKAGELLNRDPPQLHAFILEIVEQIEFVQKLPDGLQFYDCICATMQLLGQNATAEEIVKLHLLVRELNPRSRHQIALLPFVQLFRLFTAEDKLQIFAFAVLEWLFPRAQARDNIAFATSLFPQLLNSADFMETAAVVGTFLRVLSYSKRSHVVEKCMTDMLALGARLKQATQLCIFFSSAQQTTEGLENTWMELLNASDQRDRDIDTAAALLEINLQECFCNSINLFAQIAPLNLPDAVALTREVNSVFLTSSSERQPLVELLRTTAAVLNAADRPTALAIKCLTVWKSGRTRDSTQIYAFCQYVLERFGTANMKEMLDTVVATFGQMNVAVEVAYTLLQIYIADESDPSALNHQLTVLRKLRGAEVLGPFMAKLKNLPMQPKHRALFICALLDLCDSGNLQTTCCHMDSLIYAPETTQLLAVLSQLQELSPQSGIAMDLLGIAGRNSPLDVAVQLASVFVSLEAQGVCEMSVSANVKKALLQQSEELSVMLPGLLSLLQNPQSRMGALCIRLLEELGDRGTYAADLLIFACDLARELMESAQSSAVIALIYLLLTAKQDAEITIVENLKKNLPQLKGKLIDLINRVQDRVTLQDVDDLIPKQPQATELVNVQHSLMRFFDFKNSQWGQAVPLKSQILCNCCNSSYTILDDGSVICCGGTSQTGYNPGCTVHTANQFLTVAYRLSRDGTVTDLPRMKGARCAHGIIHSSRTTYVFGGCKRQSDGKYPSNRP